MIMITTHVGPAASATFTPATDSQVSYIGDLIGKHDAGTFAERVAERIAAGTLDKRDASRAIDYLKGRPLAEHTAPIPADALRHDADIAAAEGRTTDAARLYEASVTPSVRDQDVPEGRYAVRGTDGEVRFFHVDRPTEGKWAGWTFVNQRVSDDLYPVKDRAKRAGILAAIMVDADAARLLFAQEIGQCMRCGRTLTSKWRKVGMGEECASK